MLDGNVLSTEIFCALKAGPSINCVAQMALGVGDSLSSSRPSFQLLRSLPRALLPTSTSALASIGAKPVLYERLRGNTRS